MLVCARQQSLLAVRQCAHPLMKKPVPERLQEVKQLRDDFIAAAVRSQQAGYDGVEIHGAHGYIVCQFLSELYNRRDDEYGGTLENRARLLFEIVNGIRQACGPEFLLGVRLSPERFGIRFEALVCVSSL